MPSCPRFNLKLPPSLRLFAFCFFCFCVSYCCVFFTLRPPLSLSPCLLCLPPVLCFFTCFGLSHVAFQERRVRMSVPISSVVLPQAAVAPPLAELRCDWPHDDSLAHLPVKRISQLMLPENRDLAVYQKYWVLLHRSKKNRNACRICFYVCCHWFSQVSFLCANLDFMESQCCVLSVYFAVFFSLLAAISGCQITSLAPAHYCHTHVYLRSTSWVMSFWMCTVVTICYLCKALYTSVSSDYVLSEKLAYDDIKTLLFSLLIYLFHLINIRLFIIIFIHDFKVKSCWFHLHLQ